MHRFMKIINFLWLLLFFFTSSFAGEETNSTDLMTGPAGGPWRRLFLDARVVEESHNVDRVFHSARKHPDNPVLRPTRPYETGPRSSGPYLYGTVLKENHTLRMWYHLIDQGAYTNAYAESTDGLHWEKPALGLVEYDGKTDNNLFLTTAKETAENLKSPGRGRCHNPSVIHQPWVGEPDKQYVLFCWGADCGTARVAFSTDGLRWDFVEETCEEGLFPTSDVVNFFHDPYQGRYVATRKLHSRRGRSVGVAFSDDGLEWTLPVEGPVFVPDDLDPDPTQIYGMPVFAYQGLYIGMPWIYHARYFKHGDYSVEKLYDAQKDSPRTVDVQLAWSWDLINWTRHRESLIGLGSEGSWDSGMIYTARAPVVMGEQLWFYYGGFNSVHDDSIGEGRIGLATLRLDGFCSMQAGQEEGWLISQREPMTEPRVIINARTASGGWITAELLDKNNNVLEGFSREDCIPFTGDCVSHRLEWSTKKFPDKQKNSLKKIRFYLKNSHLFSYLPKL
jgi:hypothetical protein